MIIAAVHFISSKPQALNSSLQKPISGMQAIDNNGLLEAIKLDGALFVDTRAKHEISITPGISKAVVYEESDQMDLIERAKNSVIVIIYGKKESLYRTMEIAERMSKDCDHIIYYYNEGLEGWLDMIKAIQKP